MCEVCIFSLCNVIHILPRDDVASVVRRRRKRAELKWNTVWCDDLMCDIHSNDKFGFEVYLGKKSSKDVALSSFRLQGKHSEKLPEKNNNKNIFILRLLAVLVFHFVCFLFLPSLFLFLFPNSLWSLLLRCRPDQHFSSSSLPARAAIGTRAFDGKAQRAMMRRRTDEKYRKTLVGIK